MASLTIRDIPEDVLGRLRLLSERERRSLNKEFLVIVEEGLEAHEVRRESVGMRTPISRELQIAIWRELGGAWKDDRATADIIADIRSSRTAGREVRL
jgi:plasmid stability protein